jgi:DinB family protein
MLRAPDRGECPDFYFRYIDLAPKDDILIALGVEHERTVELLGSVPPHAETFRYAPGKWTIREAVGHVIDSERVFTNRAFHFARSDPNPLPSMDQDEYNDAAEYRDRPLPELVDELRAVRGATIALFSSFADETWARVGTASGAQFSVRTIPYMTVGHELHHRALLVERYLSERPLSTEEDRAG